MQRLISINASIIPGSGRARTWSERLKTKTAMLEINRCNAAGLLARPAAGAAPDRELASTVASGETA